MKTNQLELRVANRDMPPDPTRIVNIGIAIIFHEGSTLFVVANALRLLGYKEEHLMV